MAAGEEKNSDFYAVLGLKKECSAFELRTAYKNLALRWHPDRCSASGNLKFIEEAKMKFQAIQEAYSVLSDANKRFLYDVGVHDCDDDENGMGDFVSEMAVMMSQTKANGNGKESFEELQELFEEMFQRDMNGFGSASLHGANSSCFSTPCTANNNSNNNKRNCSEMSFSGMGKANVDSFGTRPGFCSGAEDGEDSRGRSRDGSRRRSGRKQKASSRHDVSSRDAGISA